MDGARMIAEQTAEIQRLKAKIEDMQRRAQVASYALSRAESKFRTLAGFFKERSARELHQLADMAGSAKKELEK
jgi:hypothetical protein